MALRQVADLATSGYISTYVPKGNMTHVLFYLNPIYVFTPVVKLLMLHNHNPSFLLL